MLEILQSAWAQPVWRAIIQVGLALLIGFVLDRALIPLLRQVARRTVSPTDDRLIEVLHRPVALSVALAGTWFALHELEMDLRALEVAGSLVGSIAVLLWAFVAMRVGGILLAHLNARPEASRFVQPRTLPVFDIGMKTLVILFAVYFLFLAWDINVTGWLASAGVFGIALGFAAKDSLANVISGLVIVSDAPYRPGDYLVLDDGTRGRVVETGLRSTRLLTRDDIAIIVPNSTMASSRIINESGGPYERARIRCPVRVAYGSDLDAVRRMLVEEAYNIDRLVLDDPNIEPRVRYRAFGDSGVELELLAWIREPEERGLALDLLIVAVYKRLMREGIEIPYPKRDVFLRQREAAPGSSEETAGLLPEPGDTQAEQAGYAGHAPLAGSGTGRR